MMTRLKPFALTLAVYPTAFGLAWIAFENPFLPYDWRLVAVTKAKNTRCVQLVEKLLDRLNPETLVLEAYEAGVSLRVDRITRLCRSLVALAIHRGIDVAVYSRDDVRSTFAGVGAQTREEIAAAVARHVDAIGYRLPRRRRPWDSEPSDMALFCAAALVLTHYRLSAARLLDDLSDAR